MAGSEDIVNIVRRVVSCMSNLYDRMSEQPREDSGNNSHTNRETGTVDQELSARFQLPRSQGSGRVVPRGRTGRFVPYTSKAKKQKGKGKAASELVIKDVCLLPTPEWNNVPRRQIKETLVRQNLFVDAWTLDKTWSEEQLRIEIKKLFTDRLVGPNDFEFVKAVGSSVAKVKLPEGQEASARIIKHVSGAGPIYVRALAKMEFNEAGDLSEESDSEEKHTSDIRSYAVWSSTSENCCPIVPEITVSQRHGSTVRSSVEVISVDEPVPCCSSDSTQNMSSTRQGVTHCQSVWGISNVENQKLREMFPMCPEDVIQHATERCFSLDGAVDYVMEFKSGESGNAGEQSVKGNTLNELLEQMRPAAVTPKRVTVRRESIFSDSVACFKQRNYDFNVPVKITFEREPAIDGGGPMREFFTILMRELLSPSADIRLFEGRNLYHLPLHNTDALRSNLFKVAGRMVTASVIQGGPGFPVFSKAVYLYFQNPNPHGLVEHITKEDVVDMEVVEALNKAMTSLCLHAVFLSRKAELDQFMSGLGPLVNMIREHPAIAEPLLVAGHGKPPTADDLLSLVTYENVDDEHKEFFKQYISTEDGRLGGVLMFATGCRTIPPMGFYNPSLITVLQNESVYPNANTCPLELELPGQVTTYVEFKKSMDSALDSQGEGFGII